MVGSIKLYVRQQLIMHLADEDADLFSAVTYQKWIDEGVKKYGTGDRGRNHVRRSVEKQKCICQILRTPATECVEVEYVFEDGGADPHGAKQRIHRVQGTGGGWISGNKWS